MPIGDGGLGVDLTVVAILAVPMARRNRRGGGLGALRVLNLLAFLPLAPRAPLYGRLLLTLATDRRVPASRKAVLALAAAYVASPWDLVPERLPLVGGLDDAVVVVLAVDVFLAGVPARVLDQKLVELGVARAELDKDLETIRRAVPKPLRAAAERIPDAVEGLAALVRRTGLERRLRAAIMIPPAGRPTARLGRPATTEEMPA